MNGFHWVTASSLVGIATIALLSTVKARSEHEIWANTERSKVQLHSKADLEQTRAKTTKDIADSYSTHQVTTFRQLIIKGYTFSHKPPQLNWKYSVDKSQKTLIYDQYRRCVGYAYQGKFYFVKYYTKACQTP
jgi:hypothetical protein